MVVTFCGHSSYVEDPTDEKTVIDILEKLSTLGDIKFILGEYGAFDIFSYKCAKKFKDRHPNAELIFITPYAYTEHRKSFDENLNSRFDLIIYPGLEKVPLK